MLVLAPTPFWVFGACRLRARTRGNCAAPRCVSSAADTRDVSLNRVATLALSNRRPGHCSGGVPGAEARRRHHRVVCAAAAPTPPVAAVVTAVAVSPWASLLDALPGVLEANVTEFATAAVVLTVSMCFLPALVRHAWQVLHRVSGTASVSALFPIRSFSVTDAELGGKLRSKARELASFETSWIAAAVVPAQIALLATVFTVRTCCAFPKSRLPVCPYKTDTLR